MIKCWRYLVALTHDTEGCQEKAILPFPGGRGEQVTIYGMTCLNVTVII